MKRLVKNAIRCKLCGDIIESTHVHDYKQCKCGAVAVDGGREYQRFIGNPEDWENMSVWEDVPGYYLTYYPMYGGCHTIAITDNINDVITNYENMWYYVEVTDENDNIIYRTDGIDKFLKEI